MSNLASKCQGLGQKRGRGKSQPCSDLDRRGIRGWPEQFTGELVGEEEDGGRRDPGGAGGRRRRRGDATPARCRGSRAEGRARAAAATMQDCSRDFLF